MRLTGSEYYVQNFSRDGLCIWVKNVKKFHQDKNVEPINNVKSIILEYFCKIMSNQGGTVFTAYIKEKNTRKEKIWRVKISLVTIFTAYILNVD